MLVDLNDTLNHCHLNHPSWCMLCFYIQEMKRLKSTPVPLLAAEDLHLQYYSMFWKPLL